MPQNKAFKNIFLLICLIAFGYTSCENKREPDFGNETVTVDRTPYSFNDPQKEIADELTGERKFIEAAEVYSNVLAKYEAAGNWEGVVYAFDRLGYFYRRGGNDSLSNASFSEGIRLAKLQLPANHILLSKVYLDQAIRAFGKPNYELSIAFLDSAYRVYNKSEFYDFGLEENIVNYKYYAFDRSGISYDSAIKYLDIRRLNDTLIEENPIKL